MSDIFLKLGEAGKQMLKSRRGSADELLLLEIFKALGRVTLEQSITYQVGLIRHYGSPKKALDALRAGKRQIEHKHGLKRGTL